MAVLNQHGCILGLVPLSSQVQVSVPKSRAESVRLLVDDPVVGVVDVHHCLFEPLGLGVAHHHAAFDAFHHSILGPVKPSSSPSLFPLRVDVILFYDSLEVLLLHYIFVCLTGPLILLQLILVE